MSQGGYIQEILTRFNMENSKPISTPIEQGGAISWETRKQRTVALSSMEAEYMAITEETEEALHLLRLLSEIGLMNKHTISIGSNNLRAHS